MNFPDRFLPPTYASWPDYVVEHTAAPMHCYPGERVSLFTRVKLLPSTDRFNLQVSLPPGFAYLAHKTDRSLTGAALSFVPDIKKRLDGSEERHLILNWDFAAPPGGAYEFEVTAQAKNEQDPNPLEQVSRATLSLPDLSSKVETVTLNIRTKAAYLNFMPSIYHDDELMGRMLMLFESILSPLEERVKHIHYYFDPLVTPPELLAWLSAWVGMLMTGDLTEKQQRWLIRKAVLLFKMRGTAQQLREFLEIVTGARVEINDTGADTPDTFLVTVCAPPLSANLSESERIEQKKLLEHRVRAIIDNEKPAHTSYQLNITYDSAALEQF